MEVNNRKKGRFLGKILLVIFSMFIGALGMYAVFYFFPIEAKEGATITNINKLEKEVTVNEQGISDAVEKIYDAVVVVETYSNKKALGSGTGFVYKVEDGKAFIMTNNHVIDGGNKVYVTFTDGKRIETEIVGGDAYADVAVLTVDSEKIISVAKIGSSVASRVGDTVFATGAPLDSTYSWSVTRGVISGKDRMVPVKVDNATSSNWIMKVVQTDAAINPGNSGGPLANSNGEVIGITSMKLVDSKVEGMGFAIPIEDALEISEKLENGVEIVRPVFGISMYNVSELLYRGSSDYDIPDDLEYGVVVVKADKGTIADKAGLKEGDIIVKMDDDKVNSVAMLRYFFYKKAVGDSAEISYYRNGKLEKVNIKL